MLEGSFILSYCLDVSKASHWHICPSGSFSGNFPYQALEYGCFEAGSRYFTIRDDRNAALLIYTLSGEGEMEWQGQSCRLVAGSAVLIHCAEHHAYKTVSKEPWVFRWLHLDGSGLGGYKSTLLQELQAPRLDEEEKFSACLDALEAIDPLSGVLACAEISQCISRLLLYMLRAHFAADDGHTLRRSEIMRVIRHIDEHLGQPLDLDGLAQVAGLSKYHFIRVFSHQMGNTPHQYLRQRRVDQARRLLQTTDLSVAEIVEQVGYRDISSFIAHFRMVMGLTPAQYRKESYRWD